jgi:hypothetical protein
MKHIKNTAVWALIAAGFVGLIFASYLTEKPKLSEVKEIGDVLPVLFT